MSKRKPERPVEPPRDLEVLVVENSPTDYQIRGITRDGESRPLAAGSREAAAQEVWNMVQTQEPRDPIVVLISRNGAVQNLGTFSGATAKHAAVETVKIALGLPTR